MPYINEEDRQYIDDLSWKAIGYSGSDLILGLSQAIKTIPSGKVKGALNYIVTRLALQVYGTSSYTDVSDAIAALQDAADEIKRRALSKVEDRAIEKNGDLPEYV